EADAGLPGRRRPVIGAFGRDRHPPWPDKGTGMAVNALAALLQAPSGAKQAPGAAHPGKQGQDGKLDFIAALAALLRIAPPPAEVAGTPIETTKAPLPVTPAAEPESKSLPGQPTEAHRETVPALPAGAEAQTRPDRAESLLQKGVSSWSPGLSRSLGAA